MAIIKVQETPLQSVFGSSTLNFNFGSNITAGNLVMVMFPYYDPVDTITVTAGGQSPTYSYDIGVYDVIGFPIHVFQNTTGGSSAITLSSTGTSYIYATAIEFSGLATSSVVDVLSTTRVGLGIPESNTTGTLSQAENLAVCWTGQRSDNTPSLYAAPTGWTLSNMNVQDWSNASAGAMAYFVTSATTALAPVWVANDSTPHSNNTRTLVLKGAGATPPAITNNAIMLGCNF